MALTGDFDASDVTTLWKETGMTNHPADGEAIEAWDDVGDAVDSALFADTTAPLYVASGINGLGSIDFNGTTQRMRAYNDAYAVQRAVSAFATVSAYTVMIAFQMDADATNSAEPIDNTGLLAENFQCWGMNVKTDTGVHTVYWNHRINFLAGGVKYVGQTFTRDVSTVALARFDGTDIFISVNGAAETSLTTGGNCIDISSTLHLAIGAGQEFPGMVGQLRLWNTGDADGNLATEWADFQAKWLGAGANAFPALTVAI